VSHWQDAATGNTEPLDELGLHPLVAQMLLRRGLTTPRSARAFLDPLHAPVTSPFALPGVEAAVHRIRSALRRQEPICIWGDFDVDGQTATTVLVQALQALGANPSHYIPVRGKESHGVHLESLGHILDRGARLVVTVDTGINAAAAVDYAHSRGVDFVVTDHHELGDTLPDAAAIVSPRLLADDHALANLAGVGVAYKLAEALLETGNLASANLLDLVVLGLIADVALLRGETRALAQRGIQCLRHTSRLGLKAIAELSDAALETLTEETIGFVFAPRLNAWGRLSDANPAVEFLLTEDPVRARVLATQIEGLNAQRRLLTEQVYQAAEEQLRADPSLLTQPVLVLSHPSWPGGVIGIAAARLVERYAKPALLFSASDDGLMRGSARSIEGLDITEAIAANHKHLLDFGGHPMAAGCSLEVTEFPAFRKGLEKTVEGLFAERPVPENNLEIDQWLSLGELSLEFARQLEQLAPFGAGNPLPVFATRSLQLKSVRQVGRSKEHRRLLVADEHSSTQEVLWWNAADQDLPDGKFDLAYSIRASSFRGEPRITVELRDFRPLADQPVEIKSLGPEIRDFRLQADAAALPSSCLIWAEALDRSRGADRFHLRRAEEFAIWTAPPARTELRMALDIVQPRVVYLIGASPAPERTDEFLTRLAGMAKFAMSHHDGRVRVSELAAATAHRELTIHLGLEWLAAGGHLLIEGSDDELRLTPGNADSDPYLRAELYAGVRAALSETAAYRAYFAIAAANSLL
jgi:single-stranded-DNA-specific exonuclease